MISNNGLYSNFITSEHQIYHVMVPTENKIGGR